MQTLPRTGQGGTGRILDISAERSGWPEGQEELESLVWEGLLETGTVARFEK